MDRDAMTEKLEERETLEKQNAAGSTESYVTLNLNARFQPMHRYELEDALDEMLSAVGIGCVDGGGTMMFPSGEVKFCDIELVLNDSSEETIAELESMIDALGVPKGSKLMFGGADDEQLEGPVGRLEGMAVYLNGTELPQEVYEDCDINYAIEQLGARMEGIGHLYSWWEGPQETALYFYGQGYDEMLCAVKDFISEYPLCQKCRIEQIA